jgi:predicted nucleotidyltransferase
VLSRLLDGVEADDRIRGFELRGSLARGDADAYSDLDVRLWLADAEFSAVLADLPSLVRGVGSTLDILFEMAGSQHLFVQFTDGVQLELEAEPVSEAKGRAAGAVVLLDRDGLLKEPCESKAPWDLAVATSLAWLHLYDIDKYLRRGSVWEAFVKLERARGHLIRHYASETGISDPQYGITSIMDSGRALPSRFDETVARLDPADIRRAASVCAEILATYDSRPYGDFARRRLTETA